MRSAKYLIISALILISPPFYAMKKDIGLVERSSNNITIGPITENILKTGGDVVGNYIGERIIAKAYGEETLKKNKQYIKDHPVRSFIAKATCTLVLGCACKEFQKIVFPKLFGL